MPRWSNFHYLKFHKPFEVLCQFSPSPPKLTLKNFINVPGVYPAGRLDYRSEGLLLLTDDSVVQHRLTSPQYQHPKTYLVQVEGLVSDSALQAIQHMDSISGQPIRPVAAEIIPDPGLSPRLPPVRDYHPTCWLRITLHEGKKHQVRRITAAAGYPTLRLVRFSIGSLTIEGLEAGQWRNLSTGEIKHLYLELSIPVQI